MEQMVHIEYKNADMVTVAADTFTLEEYAGL